MKRYNKIGQVLVKQDKTNRWLARQLDVTETTVSRWVHNNQQPTIQMLFKIGSVLGVEARNLLVRMKEIEQLPNDEEGGNA
ncbi:MAG: helix-turn-helix transcriptional regulator [Saprospiraceae bacterium]|nr:helix-turn-helix transcriptional regulator [Lewinella sp.]